jgi:hypothetical protein
LGTIFIVCFTIEGVLAILTVAVCLGNNLLARGWIGRQQQQQTHCLGEYRVDYHPNRDFTDQEEELSQITRRTYLSRAGTQSTPPFVRLVPPSAPEQLKKKNKLSEAEIITSDSSEC